MSLFKLFRQDSGWWYTLYAAVESLVISFHTAIKPSVFTQPGKIAKISKYRWRLEGKELELMGTNAECSIKDLVFSQLLQLSDR